MVIKNWVGTLLLSISSMFAHAQTTQQMEERSAAASIQQNNPSDQVQPLLAEPASVMHTSSAATTSLPQAEARLLEVARQRAIVAANFADSEQVCYKRFFVNHCLDAAKEIRRASLADLRAIEVEANHFKRADSVEQRDLALAEQARKDQEDGARRAALVPMAPSHSNLTPPPQPAQAAQHTAKKPQPAAIDETDKRAEKSAKIAQQQAKAVAQAAAQAEQRAAKVAAFELKQRTSLERQRRVAAKLAARQAAQKAAEMAAQKSPQ